jgi:transcriptional regulator with GAF, ATPase, and Fis domain
MSDERTDLLARGEELFQAFHRGLEFTKELLSENERLRRRLAELEDQQQSAARSPQEWEKLRHELLGRIRGLEKEHASLWERLQEVEQENRTFADRYVQIEEENNRLANLYVASYQLHSTLDLDEVLRVVIEIMINLVGADLFAIYLLDERLQELRPVAAEGVDLSRVPACRGAEGRLFEALAAGAPRVFEEAAAGGTDARRFDPERPLVCVPLRVDEQPIGAIAIFGLLQQKQGFSALDRELFQVLANHAATAILAARLYSHSERKLSAIQGLIDLLTR